MEEKIIKLSMVIELKNNISNALQISKDIEEYINKTLKYDVIGVHIKKEDKKSYYNGKK